MSNNDIQPTPGAVVRQLAVGFNPVSRRVIMRIVSNRGQIEIALDARQARDLVKRLEDILGKIDGDGNGEKKVIIT